MVLKETILSIIETSYTTIHELLGRDITPQEIDTMVDKCSRGNTITIGAMEVLDAKAMRDIYTLAR